MLIETTVKNTQAIKKKKNNQARKKITVLSIFSKGIDSMLQSLTYSAFQGETILQALGQKQKKKCVKASSRLIRSLGLSWLYVLLYVTISTSQS